MTDEQSLLAAIVANPDEDTPRLEWADWYEGEHGQVVCERCKGTGWATSRWRIAEMDADDYGESSSRCPECNGGGYRANPRAEFVRVQVELAPLDAMAERMPPTALIGADGMRREHLLRRQHELLAAHGREWCKVLCAVCAGKPAWQETHCLGCDNTGFAPVVWERGFPLAVSCGRLEDVVSEGNQQGSLSVSESSWQPTPWAKAVVAAHPTVLEFRCGDREPFGNGARLDWLSGGMYATEGYSADAISRAIVPLAVFEALEDGARGSFPFRVYYPTREAALTALWRALARVVKPPE